MKDKEKSADFNILSRDRLELLTVGELDFPASQIYYFEAGEDKYSFYFAHYYRRNGWDSNAFKEFSVYDFDTEIDDVENCDCERAFEKYISVFANMYQNCCYGIPDTLNNEVYNGENAIKQLREYVENVFKEVWDFKMKQNCEEGK